MKFVELAISSGVNCMTSLIIIYVKLISNHRGPNNRPPPLPSHILVRLTVTKFDVQLVMEALPFQCIILISYVYQLRDV